MRIRSTVFNLLISLFAVACSPSGNFENIQNKLSSPVPIETPTPTITRQPQVTIVYPTTIPINTPTSTPVAIHQMTSSQPTVTPTPIRQKKVERRVVFVAGLCSTNPKETFEELADWLVSNLDYQDSHFDYYNYAEDGDSGEPYEAMETLKWIRGEGGSAQNFRIFLTRLHNQNPNAKFAVVTHSLGGVLTLYALEQYPELEEMVYSVLTINSPLRGLDLLKLNIRQLYPCVVDYVIEKLKTEHTLRNPPVLVELKEDSPVISAVTQANYSGINVVTLANSNDPVLVSTGYSSGELGTLPNSSVYIHSFGIDVSKSVIERYGELVGTINQQHIIPLLIRSLEKQGRKETVEFMERTLRYAIKPE